MLARQLRVVLPLFCYLALSACALSAVEEDDAGSLWGGPTLDAGSGVGPDAQSPRDGAAPLDGSSAAPEAGMSAPDAAIMPLDGGDLRPDASAADAGLPPMDAATPDAATRDAAVPDAATPQDASTQEDGGSGSDDAGGTPDAAAPDAGGSSGCQQDSDCEGKTSCSIAAPLSCCKSNGSCGCSWLPGAYCS